MKPHEIQSAIGEALTGHSKEWWNGLDDQTKNELVILAQREGLDRAISEAQELGELPKLEITNLKAFGDVILTEGGIVYGHRIYGVFANEEDARSEDADNLVLGILHWGDLTEEQAEIAKRNSEAL